MNLKDFYTKHKGFILYSFFGTFTFLINMFAYWFFFCVCGMSNVLSTIISWLLAVTYAFITNKIWVFNSKSWHFPLAFIEFIKFFSCRGATGLFDVIVMWLSVDVMHWNAILWKLISNVFVVATNYIASRLVIFKKKD